MPCTIPCQTPKGHLNSVRGLVGPNPPHVKDCDNICWHLTTIFAGPGASMFAAKFVDNICQSASQVFASLAHPSAADNHTLSDGPRHGPIHGPKHPTDQYALCCRSKLILFANFKYLLPPKTICVWIFKYDILLLLFIQPKWIPKESFEDFSATCLFVCGKSVCDKSSQKIFQRNVLKFISELLDVQNHSGKSGF